MTLTPEIEAYGDYIAGLKPAERAAAKSTLRQYVVAQMDPEEFGEDYKVSNLGQYLDRKIENPPMLVEPGLVARGAINAMTARAGKGKTTVSLNKLVRWSMGKPLFDGLPDVLKPVKPLRSLIVENEGAPGHFQNILRKIVTQNDFTAEEIALARENVHIWGDGGWSGLKLDVEANVDLISTAAAKTKADIVFIEPFRGLWRGDENSSTDMAEVLDAMSRIANDNMCGLMLTHHETKSGGSSEEAMDAARGSTAFEAHAAVMERWSHIRGGSELSWVKWRFDEPPAPVQMRFNRDRWSFDLIAADALERDVLKLLQQFPGDYFDLISIREDLELMAKQDQSLRRTMRSLVEQEKVRERKADGKSQWTIRNGSDPDDQIAVI